MEIINGKYKIENTMLGSGGFSEVFLGTDITTNQPVAIKKVKLTQKNLKNDDGLKNLNSEIELMKTFNHPNIVKYFDVVKTSNTWYIIMEYCNMGTLHDVIIFNESMSKKKVVNFNREANTYYYLDQLKDALDYLRKSECIHRDIKPMNVLLTKTNLSSLDTEILLKSDEQLLKDQNSLSMFHLELSNSFDKSNLNRLGNKEKIIVKLADFGLARKQNFPSTNLNYEVKNTPHIDNEELMKTICGSPLYMAPEVILVKEYDSRAELWSFGIIMYELLFGTHPQKATSFSQLINNLKSQNIDFQLHKNYTPECFDLLKKLLDKNPSNRISWVEFFNHKWFNYWKNINCDNNDKVFVRNTSMEINRMNLMTKNEIKYEHKESLEKNRTTDYFTIHSGKNNKSVEEYYTDINTKPFMNKLFETKRKSSVTLNPIITEPKNQSKNFLNSRNSSNKNLRSPSEPIIISLNKPKNVNQSENPSPNFNSHINDPSPTKSPLGKNNLSRMKLDNFYQKYSQGTYSEHSASYPPVDPGKISKSFNPDENNDGIPKSKINNISNSHSYERPNSYGESYSSFGKNSTSRSRIFQNFNIRRKNSIGINDNSNLLQNSISLQKLNNKTNNLSDSDNFTHYHESNVSEEKSDILDENIRLDMSEFVITKNTNHFN